MYVLMRQVAATNLGGDDGVAVASAGGADGEPPQDPNPEQIAKMLRVASERSNILDDAWADDVGTAESSSGATGHVPENSGKEGLPMANAWTDAADQGYLPDPPGLSPPLQGPGTANPFAPKWPPPTPKWSAPASEWSEWRASEPAEPAQPPPEQPTRHARCRCEAYF
jgi:hypothetical protein